MTCYPITRDGEHVGFVCTGGTEYEITHRGRTWRFEEASGYAFPHPLRKRDGKPFERVPKTFWDAYDVWRARQDAYHKGAEAMRAQVLNWLVRAQAEATVIVVDTAIRSVDKLPIPEDEP